MAKKRKNKILQPQADSAPDNAAADNAAEISPVDAEDTPCAEPEAGPAEEAGLLTEEHEVTADPDDRLEEAAESSYEEETEDVFMTAPLEKLPGAGFEETVENADVSKIESTYKGKRTRVLNAAFFVRLALLTICGALFMYSAVSIANRFADDMKSEQFIEGLISNNSEKSAMARLMKSHSAASPLCLYDALGVDEYKPEFAEPEISDRYDSVLNTIAKLKEINPEIDGWIRCTGGMLSINYPAYKAADNDYYLRRNIYGEYSVGGTIFVDYRDSDRHGESYNTIFYGHNMTNGTMFRAIKDWFDSADRESPQATYVYEIFSAYRSDGSDFITVSFRDNAAYKDFLKMISRRSILKRRLAYDENTRLITLCTCTNSGRNEDERYVLHCKLVKIIKYN